MSDWSASSPRSPRVQVKRLPERAGYERETIHAILDEARICHVGFVSGGQPYVIPTIHARAGDRLYLHGSTASRMLRALAAGTPICVTATILDGLVLARSAFHHSMNYRSVVILGTAEVIERPDEKLEALRAIVEHIVPGRWAQARRPSGSELRQTAVLGLSLVEASAKIRSGPPKDAEDDLDLPVWAGVIPLTLVAGEPVPDQPRASRPRPSRESPR
jgi:uncharacterized protein